MDGNMSKAFKCFNLFKFSHCLNKFMYLNESNFCVTKIKFGMSVSFSVLAHMYAHLHMCLTLLLQ